LSRIDATNSQCLPGGIATVSKICLLAITTCLVTPAIFKPGSMVLKNQKKKQKRGFPIEDLGNDGGGGHS